MLARAHACHATLAWLKRKAALLQPGLHAYRRAAEACAGALQSPPDWQEILTHFRGSELQNYFTRILEDDLHAIIKPQYVDHIPKAVRCASAWLHVAVFWHGRRVQSSMHRCSERVPAGQGNVGFGAGMQGLGD